MRAATAGEFEIVREIGHGGMARVYLANELALDRSVALKVLSPLFSEYPEIVRRFQQEARTAGQLSHPHIVPVFAVYHGDGLSFFTMPFVDGVSLREILRAKARLEVDDALEFLQQAASGLAYAHVHGVVHRDVKPENMLLEEATDRLVLTDFGLAKALGSESLTVPGDMIGTPHYMAPEQCEGDKEIDGRSDQYSLALVGYEMLAGKYPFEVHGLRELLMKQLSEDPTPLHEIRPMLPSHVSHAIQRALSKDPDGRFPSIEAFAKALTAEGESVSVNGSRRAEERPRSQARDGFEAKTLWMRDRLLRSHKQRRARRWLGRASMTAAAATMFYIAVAAVSRGGPPARSVPAPSMTASPALAISEGASGVRFAEVDVDDAGAGLAFVGPLTEDRARRGDRRAALDPAPRLASSPRGSVPGSGAAPPPSRPEPKSSERAAAGRGESRRSTSAGGWSRFVSGAENGASRKPAQGPDDGGGSSAQLSSSSDPGIDSDPGTAFAGRKTVGSPEYLIEGYRRALEAEDMAGITRMYGGEIPERDLALVRRIFESADELDVEVEASDIDASGSRQVVDVDFPMRYVLKRTRRPQKYTLKLRMAFESGPEGWRLVALEQR